VRGELQQQLAVAKLDLQLVVAHIHLGHITWVRIWGGVLY
jgi:hypothetical protein